MREPFFERRSSDRPKNGDTRRCPQCLQGTIEFNERYRLMDIIPKNYKLVGARLGASCRAGFLLRGGPMARDVAATMDAINELHKEWGTLVSLRRAVRDAPYDETAECDLIARLERHREKLHALRSSILEDAEERRPSPLSIRAAHSAHH